MANQYPLNTSFEESMSKQKEMGSKYFKPLREAVSAASSRMEEAPKVEAPIQAGSMSGSPLELIKNVGTLTTQYGGSTNYEKFHPGIDIANKIGTPIPFFAPGKVVDIRTGMSNTPGQGSFGNYVVVEDSMGNKHRYSHLDQAYVKVGQDVTTGQFAGTMGNTGGAYSTSGGSGAHLDFRILDAAGKYLDPNRFLSNIK